MSSQGSEAEALRTGNNQRNPLDPLSDANSKVVPTFANESKQHQTLHARLMQQQQPDKRGGAPSYTSPSDMILSPASAKLNAFKEKRFNKSSKPRALFAKTDSSSSSDSQEGPSGNVNPTSDSN